LNLLSSFNFFFVPPLPQFFLARCYVTSVSSSLRLEMHFLCHFQSIPQAHACFLKPFSTVPPFSVAFLYPSFVTHFTVTLISPHVFLGTCPHPILAMWHGACSSGLYNSSPWCQPNPWILCYLLLFCFDGSISCASQVPPPNSRLLMFLRPLSFVLCSLGAILLS